MRGRASVQQSNLRDEEGSQHTDQCLLFTDRQSLTDTQKT